MKQSIREKFSDCVITIHIEPCEGKCTEDCVAGCLLAEDKRLRLALK